MGRFNLDLRRKKNPEDKWLFLILFMSTAFQVPEIVEYIGRFINYVNYYIYFLKSIPILLFYYLSNKIVGEKKFIPTFLFAIFYSIFEFNGVYGVDKLIFIIPSFFSIFSLIFMSYFFAEKNNVQQNFLAITKVALLSTGIFILAINIFDKQLYINIYLYLGLLISIPRSFIVNLFFFFSSFAWAFLSGNRTIILIIILNALIYISRGRFFSNGRFLAIFLYLFICAANLFIVIEANAWFTNSILSGRAGIWNYWLDILNSNISYTFLGIGFRSDDYVNFSLIGDRLNSIGYFSQLHSGFIATLVRGGWLLLFLNLVYFLYLLRNTVFDNHKCYIAYSLVIFMTINTSFDYFYPTLLGLIFLFTITEEHHKGALLQS